MKPFNLEEALAGAKVLTREGKEVTEIFRLKTTTMPDQKILAVIDGRLNHFYLDGKSWSKYFSENDLFMAPVKVKKWVNVYSQNLHNTYVAAKAAVSVENTNYINTIEIEVEL